MSLILKTVKPILSICDASFIFKIFRAGIWRISQLRRRASAKSLACASAMTKFFSGDEKDGVR
ncbi:hypothetical protein CH337_17615 [Rhodoblastus acidophilus]|nr:hypothetical protein CKO16_00095 [Rhodoblastus acidophilus]RAI17160.1 hypothetical protein CH337_17615 [Rhodoblastus acidophilus]